MNLITGASFGRYEEVEEELHCSLIADSLHTTVTTGQEIATEFGGFWTMCFWLLLTVVSLKVSMTGNLARLRK